MRSGYNGVMQIPSNPRTTRWRRIVLTLAGIALLALLAALFLTLIALTGGPGAGAALLALACIAIALLAVFLLATGLLADPTLKEVDRRLERLEDRLARLEGHAGEAAPATVHAPEQPAQAPVPAPDATAVPPGRVPLPPEPVPQAMPAVPIPPTEPMTPAASSGTTGSTAEAPPASREGWELALGRRWLGRIGAAVLVIAVALFLKLGWDQGWLRPSETVRVLFGLTLGAALLTMGEVTRRRTGYGPQAQALGAAGLGSAVLALWAAVTLYHLVPALVGLVLIVLAAAGVAAYAVAVSGEVLTVLAVLTGFGAPHLVPSSPADVPAILAVAAAFTAGSMAAVLRRGWPLLPWVAVAGTLLDLLRIPNTAPRPVSIAIAWAAGLAVVAVVHLGAAALAARRDPRSRGIRPVMMAGAAGAFLCWGNGMTLLDSISDGTAAAWSAFVLLLIAGTWWIARHREGAGILAGTLGLTAWLPAVTLPNLLLDGPAVGLAWAVLALGTGYLALRKGSRGWELAASPIAVLAAVQPFPEQGLKTVEGALEVLGIAVLLTVLLAIAERMNSALERPLLRLVSSPAAAVAFVALGTAASHALGGFLAAPVMTIRIETMIRLATALAGGAAIGLASTASSPVTTRIAAGLLLAGGLLPARAPALLLHSGNFAVKAFLGPARLVVAALAVLVLAAVGRSHSGDWRRWHAWGTAVATALLAFPFARAIWSEHSAPLRALPVPLLLAVAAGLLLGAAHLGRHWTTPPPRGWIENAGWFVLLVALSHLLTILVSADSAVTILWGLAGLGALAAGLLTRTPHRRHFGLALLGLTVATIFLRDLAHASTLIRVVAFAVTGAALIAGSFLYARFRELLGTEPGTAPEEDGDGW